MFQNFRRLPSSITKSISDGVDHSLRDFLARPKLIHNFTWTTTAAAGDSLFNVTLPGGIVQERVFAAKLAGFAWMRATVVVRMMVNTQRFQAGRLMMTWMPLAKQNQTKFNDTKFLCYYSQRPRVEFDAATDTEVIMRIPYIHPALAFDLTSGKNDGGRLDIVCYSPLTSGSVTGNIYYSFEDVELEYATEPGTFIAQSAPFKPGKTVGKDPGDKEAADMGVRPVSSMLSSLATTASIGAEIPLISSVAGPVSWAASIAAKAAHAFGYAKPLNLAPRLRVYEQNDTHRINCDGAHMAVNFGVFEDNKICHVPGFAGSDLDEMALSATIGKYSFMKSFAWTTSMNEGTKVLNNLALRPYNNPSQTRTLNVAGVSSTVFDLPPFSYVSTLFQLYRGSFKLKFKIVKTEFHSGRLRLNYYLQSDLTAAATPQYSSANVHSSIFDLRESNEFEVVIPYGAATPYLPVNTTYARVNLCVETPLQAIGDVSTSVDIIMEMCAADDFEFAMPVPAQLIPTTTAFSNVEAQSGLGSTSEPLQDARDAEITVGGAHVMPDNHNSAEICIGEKILSFRQLLKRMNRYIKLVQKQKYSGAVGWNVVQGANIGPWSMPIPNSIQPVNYGNTLTLGIWTEPDYFTYIGCMFSMMRGSMRLAYRENAGPTITYGNTYIPSWASFAQSGSVTYKGDETVATIDSDPTYPNGHEISLLTDSETVGVFDTHYEDIQVPYYNRTHSSITPICPWLVGDQTTPIDNPGPQYSFVPSAVVKLSGGLAAGPESEFSVYRWIYRAIGEDFSFGYFSGTYPVVAVNTTGWPGRNVP